MKAEQIFYDKQINPVDGTIIEMVIWQVPAPVVGSRHQFKCRLFFGRAGERIVGYCQRRLNSDPPRRYRVGINLTHPRT